MMYASDQEEPPRRQANPASARSSPVIGWGLTNPGPRVYHCLSSHHTTTAMIRFMSRVSLKLADQALLSFIRKHPGSRLFEINAATLKSHHSWGTKSVLARLEAEGWLYVQRSRHGKRIPPRYFVLAERGPRHKYLAVANVNDWRFD